MCVYLYGVPQFRGSLFKKVKVLEDHTTLNTTNLFPKNLQHRTRIQYNRNGQRLLYVQKHAFIGERQAESEENTRQERLFNWLSVYGREIHDYAYLSCERMLYDKLDIRIVFQRRSQISYVYKENFSSDKRGHTY